ncbi:hypothetical protein L6R46_18090 [Myxococcota bacterium]|nr:hypothetical protein [Myxococcota bacterium]
MNITSSLQTLWANDPITVVVTVIALWLLGFATITRRGGVDSGMIIQLFGSLATLGTLAKVVNWGVQWAIGSAVSSYVPSGTDLVLFAGMVVAAFWSNMESLLSLLGGDPSQPSRWERFRYFLGTQDAWWSRLLKGIALTLPAVQEDEHAATERKQGEQAEPPSAG